MSAIKPREVPALLQKRDLRFAAYLIYGPDGGAVRERSDILAQQVVSDLKDPFNFIELTENDLRDEPSRLVDEAAALSFMGGERVVRVRGSNETVSAAAKLLLQSLDAGTFEPNAVTLIEAGELRKSAGLRKAFETAKRGAAIACYEDNPADIRALIEGAIAKEGLTLQPEAMELLAGALGSDRGISRSELDKLILYKGSKAQRNGASEITAEDVRACIVDSSQDAAFDVAAVSAGGNPGGLSAVLHRASAAGVAPITILIFLQRHFMRLYSVQAAVSAGMPPDAAMKKLRPPVFFADQKAFQTQLRKWPLAKLERAMTDLTEVEHLAKRTGAPQRELIERLALRLAVMAK